MGYVINYAAPVLPGQSERARNFEKELEPHMDEFLRLNKEATITRFQTFLQETPMGDLQLYLMEADDPTKLRQIIPGGTPYDEWWLDYLRDVNGIDLRTLQEKEPPTPPAPVFTWPPA
ncbi:MAG: hypothetical protein ACRDH9_03385 [Actinomycetota bacterium]